MALARHKLRARRERMGLSQEALALAIGVGTSTYREWEAGVSKPIPGRRPALARTLEVTLDDIADYFDEVKLNGHAVPDWLDHLASMEQGATRLGAVEVTTVHGLLQTADYAAAVEGGGPAVTDAKVARRVEIRLDRQSVLTRHPDPLQLHVILDESVLRRVAGGPDVMAAQLDHLVELADRPNVTIQVLPLDSGVFVFGSFWLFYSGGEEPYMAVVEDRSGPNYLSRPPDREAHVAYFDWLATVALSPDQTVEFARTVAKEYRSHA